MILPDCFNLDKPLPGFSSVQSSVGDPTASIKSHDSQVTTLLDAASVKAELPTSHVTSTPPPVGGASPDTAQKANFVPERITLKQVKESRRYNPITVATGLVNTVTDLVDKRVHFGTRKTTEVPPPSHDSSSSDSDDNFEVFLLFSVHLFDPSTSLVYYIYMYWLFIGWFRMHRRHHV